MRVLIFQAATSAVAIAAMTRLSDEMRAAGYNGGLRQLQNFRNEKEPADRVLIALKPSEAAQFKNQGAALATVFNDADRIIPLELPEDDDELKDFDFGSAIGKFDDAETGFMTLDQLRAEAVERGIEVRADTTAEELAHALDVDISPGPQAGDRVTDRKNAAGPASDRIGFRTSNVLPTANGLDLDRMNDEQLAGVAAALGLKVPKNANRKTVVNKIMATYADKVGAPGAGVESEAEQPSTDEVALDGLDADQLKAIADAEGIDVGQATSVDTLTTKITEARKAKAKAASAGTSEEE